MQARSFAEEARVALDITSGEIARSRAAVRRRDFAEAAAAVEAALRHLRVAQRACMSAPLELTLV
jgi:hypothetical protein